jgi:hypothetical protein
VHNDTWSKVSVVLFDRRIHDLDRLISDMRTRNGKAMNRAGIIRALIDGVIESGMDVASAASDADLHARVARRLGTPPAEAVRARAENLLCFDRARHVVVPEMREVAAPPLAPAIVGGAGAPARDRARTVPLPRLQLARVARRVHAGDAGPAGDSPRADRFRAREARAGQGRRRPDVTDLEKQKAEELISRLELSVGQMFPRDGGNAALLATMIQALNGLRSLLGLVRPH